MMVINRRRTGRMARSGDVYVGRPTIWGNPFELTNSSDDEERQRVIELYREHIAEHPELVELLRDLRPERLVCWCAPKPCHADVLAELLKICY